MNREGVALSLRRFNLRLAYRGLTAWWWAIRPITVGVRVVLVRDEQVMLVRHTYRPGWFLPGGGLKRGETLEAAARREAREEVGATLAATTFVGLYSSFSEHKSDHVAVFACCDFTLDGTHDAEIAAVQAFPLDSFPAGVVPGTRERIADYLAVQGGALPRAGQW